MILWCCRNNFTAISLVKKYKEHAKRLRKTGEGVKDDDEDEDEETQTQSQETDEFLDSYVGPGGPDQTTSQRIRNIWGNYFFF